VKIELSWASETNKEFACDIHEIYLVACERGWGKDGARLPVRNGPRFAPLEQLLLLKRHYINGSGSRARRFIAKGPT